MKSMPKNSTKGLIVKETAKGKGVFASRNYTKGEFIIRFNGKTYSKEEYKTLVDFDNNHFLQIAQEIFIGPSGELDDLINHSCQPNCGVVYTQKEICLCAIKDIKKGEEICFDYSTTMAENYWEMECCCGSPDCRRIIQDFQCLPQKLKKNYLSHGVVPEFIQKQNK
jgi:SET domain-containing protein